MKKTERQGGEADKGQSIRTTQTDRGEERKKRRAALNT